MRWLPKTKQGRVGSLLLIALLGSFLMFASGAVGDLTIPQGLLYGAFVGFPYGHSMLLAAKLSDRAS